MLGFNCSSTPAGFGVTTNLTRFIIVVIKFNRIELNLLILVCYFFFEGDTTYHNLVVN